jgi:hypothetical protein
MWQEPNLYSRVTEPIFAANYAAAPRKELQNRHDSAVLFP